MDATAQMFGKEIAAKPLSSIQGRKLKASGKFTEIALNSNHL